MKNKDLFINKMIKSIKNFDYYKDISTEKFSSGFKYFSVLILIYSIIVTIGICHNFNKNLENARNFIQSEITNIDYVDGFMSINNDEYISYYNDYIIIDTSSENVENYNADIAIGKSSFYIKINGYKFNFKYSNLLKNNLNKNDIIDVLSFRKYCILLIVMSLILAFIILGISTLFDILIIALIGFITSKIFGKNKIGFKNCFNISIHAITLSVVLAMIYYLINVFTVFNIKYFATMYTSIATIYEITAVILINTDKQ